MIITWRITTFHDRYTEQTGQCANNHYQVLDNVLMIT